MFRGPSLRKVKRFGCGAVGVLAIVTGLLHSGHAVSYSYRNWFGGLACGPIVAVLGILALLAAIFNWRSIWDSPPADQARRKGRSRSAEALSQLAVLYSQASRQASQYMSPSVQRRTSSWDWQYTQNLSHEQLSSGRSHWAQTMRLTPGLEDMVEV